jgi:hypothetical protein
MKTLSVSRTDGVLADAPGVRGEEKKHLSDHWVRGMMAVKTFSNRGI